MNTNTLTRDQLAKSGTAEQQAQEIENLVVDRLLEGKNAREIAGELEKGGSSKEEAIRYVTAMEQYIKNSPEGRRQLAAKYSKRVLFGFFWVAAGVTATMVFEGWLFWGAILFGLWDILSGLVGWVKYH